MLPAGLLPGSAHRAVRLAGQPPTALSGLAGGTGQSSERTPECTGRVRQQAPAKWCVMSSAPFELNTLEATIAFEPVVTVLQTVAELSGAGYGVQGLMTARPAASNGPVSRVAMAKPCAEAMAAMYPSGVGKPLPARRAVTASRA